MLQTNCFRNCFSKLKSDGSDEGTMSIDPLVPLQTVGTSPTAIAESTLDHVSKCHF